jgi:hypothetical protein
MIGMPPTIGTSMDDYGAHLGALAAVTSRPVIVAISHQHQEFRGP